MIEVNGERLEEEKIVNITNYFWKKGFGRCSLVNSLTLDSSVIVNLCLGGCKIASGSLVINLPNLVVLQIDGCGLRELRANIPKIVQISASCNYFSSFSGYEFPLLDKLWLEKCSITDFSRNKFPKLTIALLGENQISWFKDNFLPALEYLNIYSNRLREFKADLPSIKGLILVNNPDLSFVRYYRGARIEVEGTKV